MPSIPWKKRAKTGSATSSASARNAKRRERLREPDRAAVARGEHEPVEHALLPLGDEGAAEAEQRGEDDRDPEQPARGEIRRARRKREVEDDEDRDDEEQHRRQRVARAQLEQQVLARERAHVGGVAHASASVVVASGAMRAGSWVETRNVRSCSSSASCASSSSAPCASSAVYGSSSTSSAGLVQEHAAEREPLRHAARVRRDAIVAHVPQPVALEQHADPLAPFGDAVEAAVEIEVLERRELAVDERLVAEVADLGARARSTRSSPSVGTIEAGAEAEERRLAGAVRAGDDGEAAARQLEVDVAQHALLAEAATQLPSLDHRRSLGVASSATRMDDGITLEELQLAARNHGLPLESAARADHAGRAALPADPLRHPGGRRARMAARRSAGSSSGRSSSRSTTCARGRRGRCR